MRKFFASLFVLLFVISYPVFAQTQDSTQKKQIDTLKTDSLKMKTLNADTSKKDTSRLDTLAKPIVIEYTKVPVDKYPLPMENNPLSVAAPQITLSPLPLKPYIIDSKINYWRTKTSIGVNLNQSSFSSNWKAGGVNSVAIGGLVNYRAEYNKGNFNFTHETNLQYGKVKNKSQMDRKTVDRIFLDNKFGYQISKSWNFFSSLTFESQFDAGFNYSTTDGVETATLISKFMSPGYLTESVGMEYKPTKYFSLRLGMASARQSFVLDTTIYKTNSKNFGVPIGQTVRNEMAFQVTANFEKDITQNINLKWRYWMFVPYQLRTFNDVKHRLDATVTAKVSRYFNINLGGTILYDKDMDLKVQTSQALAVGIMVILPR